MAIKHLEDDKYTFPLLYTQTHPYKHISAYIINGMIFKDYLSYNV